MCWFLFQHGVGGVLVESNINGTCEIVREDLFEQILSKVDHLTLMAPRLGETQFELSTIQNQVKPTDRPEAFPITSNKFNNLLQFADIFSSSPFSSNPLETPLKIPSETYKIRYNISYSNYID